MNMVGDDISDDEMHDVRSQLGLRDNRQTPDFVGYENQNIFTAAESVAPGSSMRTNPRVSFTAERGLIQLERLLMASEKRQSDYLSRWARDEAELSGEITLNMGVGEAVADKKVLENAVGDMEKIAGQKAVKTLARKSVAGFKIRDGYPIGCKVTLRRERMYEFLDRLVNIAIPRIRDFRGLNPKSFDKQGNYSMGVSEQIIFPEINYDEIDTIRGLDITISTSAKNADEGRALLEAFNFPFKK